MRLYPFRRYVARVAGSAAFLLCVVTVAPGLALAAPALGPGSASNGWHAVITGHESLPQRLVAVDKREQALLLLEQQSPLRLSAKYTCTTGQNLGDKLVRGDLKTPEGVYFVVSKLTQGLDFEKYGYEAYTLNYPNPVDKLRKKTGYGIWIHGRGVPIEPYITEGCVSLNNQDLAALAKNLTPGTPVTMAENISFTPKASPADKAVIDSLNKRTFEWAKAWAGKSKKLFEFYNPEAYSVAQGESFTAFRAQKERVFKNVSYIDITLRNVQTLAGPGYWVTWFQQDYKASNLSTQGVRRLYWQKDPKGTMRIVGMEWHPQLSGTLSAGINEAPAIAREVAKPAPEAPVAVAEAPRQTPPRAEATPVPVAQAAPQKAPQAQPPVVPQPEVPTPSVTVARADLTPQARPTSAPRPKTPDVMAFLETWRLAWEKGDLNAYIACYDEKAVQGGRTGAAAIRTSKRSLWKKSNPKEVVLTNMRITSKQDTVVIDMQQSYTDSNSFADMGIKTIHLALQGNAWRILREDWTPMQQ